MGNALNFPKTRLTQPKGFGIKQNSNIKTKKNIKKKIKSKAQTQNKNAGTASISSSNKNRLKWLSNWKRVFSFWRWSPGIFFISSIQKSIPVYYKEYNPAKQKSLSKSTAFLKDSKTRLWKDQITKLSEIEKKEYEKRNSFYILQYLNLENHPFFNGEFTWKHGLCNAKLVIEQALYYSDTYELLINNYFITSLNLHKSVASLTNQCSDIISENISKGDIENSDFFKSSKNQKQFFNDLDISQWNYETVIVSAICFVLSSIIRNWYVKKFTYEDLNRSLSNFLIDIQEYTYFPVSSKLLFSILAEIQLFSSFPEPGLRSLQYLISHLIGETNTISFYDCKNTIIKYCKLFNLSFLTSENFFQSILIEEANTSKQIILSETFMPIWRIYKEFFAICDVLYQKKYWEREPLFSCFNPPEDFNLLINSRSSTENRLLSIQESINSENLELEVYFHIVAFVVVFFSNTSAQLNNYTYEKCEAILKNAEFDENLYDFCWQKLELENIFHEADIQYIFLHQDDILRDLENKYSSTNLRFRFRIVKKKIKSFNVFIQSDDIIQKIKTIFSLGGSFVGFYGLGMVVLPPARSFGLGNDFFNAPATSRTISLDPPVRNIRAQANQKEFQLDNSQAEQVISNPSLESIQFSPQDTELVSKSAIGPEIQPKKLKGLKNSPVFFNTINQKICHEARKEGFDYSETASGYITFQKIDNSSNIVESSQAPMAGPYGLLPSTNPENSRCHMLGQRQNEFFGVNHKSAPCIICDSRINTLEERSDFQEQVRNYKPTRALIDKPLKYTIEEKLELKHDIICEEIANWKNNSLLGFQAQAIKLTIPFTIDSAVERAAELQVAPKNSFLSEIMVNDPIKKVKYINDNVLTKWLDDAASGAKRVSLEHLLKSCTAEVANLNVCHTRSVVELQDVSTNNIATNYYADDMDIELSRFRNLSKKAVLHSLNLHDRGLPSPLKLEDITLSLNTVQGNSPFVVEAPKILTYENYDKFVDKICDTVIKVGNEGKSINFDECISKSCAYKIGDFTKRSKAKALQFGTAEGNIIQTHSTRYEENLTNRLALLQTDFSLNDVDESNYTL